MLNRSQKEQQVAELTEQLKATSAAFLADYRGINVEQETALRAKLREAGVTYKVVKNNLLKLAAKDADVTCLNEYMAGPTAIAFAGADVVAPAKILSEFAKTVQAFELKAGVMGGKLMTAADIQALSDLPSREQLLASALSSMNAPVSNFVGVMAAIPRSLVNVLTAVKDQKAA